MSTRKRAMSKKQLQEIQQLNRRASKKKSNLKSRYGVVVEDIPKIDINLKGKALKEQIQKVESFLNPHNTKYQYVKNSEGVVFNKSEVNQAKAIVDRANRIRKKEYNKLANTIMTVGNIVGKIKDISPSRIYNAHERRPLKFDLDNFTSLAEFRRIAQKRKESYGGDFIRRQREMYMQNYMQGLRESMGDASDTKALIEYLEDLTPTEFYQLSVSRPQLELKYIYDPQHRETVMERIRTNWELSIRDLKQGKYKDYPE